MSRPRLAPRYWASLTDARPEELDHLIEHGRRRDLPLWRRYVASLLDVHVVAERRAEERDSWETVGEAPTSTVLYTLDPVVAVAGPTHPPRPRQRRAGLVLAAVVAAATVIGVQLLATGPANDPVVIGGSPHQSPPPGAHRESGGFAWDTPEGWRRDVKSGAEVHYTSPDGKQELVAKASLRSGDLMEVWKTSERNAQEGDGYRKIRLEEATFHGWPAVIWEYTFSQNGVSWHAQLLGFAADGKTYQVNTWYQPDIEADARKIYERVRDSFTVL
ncbi:hypothetical protein [Streptomyces sp. S3(2020)]|uniref:hypothetical protein n=1 Tax=Streptomyces sp. S3(2020) TaxID=2732044 RepID=UPI0019D31B82|nr:hypothetical protein [Streptomyces sp. S3(2020)]